MAGRPMGKGTAFLLELLVLLCVTSYCALGGNTSSKDTTTSNSGSFRMRFIVSVNATWDPQNPGNFSGCLTTVSTPFLDSDRSVNETHPFSLGSCDNGALTFGFTERPSRDGYSQTDVYLTYYSSRLTFATDPSCYIPWNGTYLNPLAGQMDRSPLPSCFFPAHAQDWRNRTAVHVIDYWFRIMDWEVPPQQTLE